MKRNHNRIGIIIIFICLILACGIIPAAAQGTDNTNQPSGGPITGIDLGVDRLELTVIWHSWKRLPLMRPVSKKPTGPPSALLFPFRPEQNNPRLPLPGRRE